MIYHEVAHSSEEQLLRAKIENITTNQDDIPGLLAQLNEVSEFPQKIVRLDGVEKPILLRDRSQS